MFVFGLCSTSGDQPSNPRKKDDQDAKKLKKPPKSSKNKMFVFQLHQLLMIGRVIWAKKVDFNTKNWKRPPKSSKNKMFIFGLHSTSDDRPSNPSKKWWPKQKKQKRSLSHWKIKCLFLDYVQLLIIGWAIWAKNIDQDAKNWKRPPKSSKNKMFHFWITFNFWWLAERSQAKNIDRNARKLKKAP